jgi:lipopolysaccharide export system permease protein
MLFGGTLNRTIFWELVKVFLLSLGSLTGLFVLAGLIQQASQMGLSPMQVVTAIPLFIPSSLPFTIPATTLFASCVVYGRLAHDNEVVAIKGAGVHLFTILKPALTLGVVTAAITAGLYHSVIPLSQQLLQEEMLRDPEEVMYNWLRRDRCIRHPTFPYVLYVKDVQGRRLIDVILKQRVRVVDPVTGLPGAWNGYDRVARAREARLRVDATEGKLYLDADRFVFYEKNTQGATPPNGPFPIPMPDNLTANDSRNRPMALTWDSLGPRMEDLARERTELETSRVIQEETASKLADETLKKRYSDETTHFQARVENLVRQSRNVQAEFYMRPALAAGCLVFALLGCPVGIWANRADYLSTFVICFLPTVFVYYPLLLAGSNMGKDGKLSLGLGCWLANIVMGTAGLFLTARLLRR